MSDEQLRKADLSAQLFDLKAAAEPPARARAVVIGGGIIGASVAYHLAALGWTDTVILERHSLASGTSWHAAGLMTRTRGTHMLTDLATYSGAFYAGLAQLSGVDIGYHESGSLSLARTDERLTELRYALAMARHHGLPAQELRPAEIATVSPLLDPAGLVGGVLFEGDATVNPGVAAFAAAKAAFDLGVRTLEGSLVTGFRLEKGRVTGVHTDRGTIACEVAVIAAGLWSRGLGLLAGARLPLYAAEHMWVQTEPLEGASRDLPIVRDLDGHFYARHYRGGLVIGAFEPHGKPRAESSLPPHFAFGEFGADWEHFELPLSRARVRIPALADAHFAHFLNAPESFTPDADFLLGETAEVAGLYVAAGLNSQGIIFGPGVGRALAQWIDAGAPTIDAAQVDVRRFAPAQANAAYLHERTRESLGRLYAMHWPFLQPEAARGLRRAPLYERLAAAGACFGEVAGWERADWFARDGMQPVDEYSFGRQNWFQTVAGEHRAAREGVALFDLSTFAKLRVQGPGAPETLQRVFTADLDRPVGAVAYTLMLNHLGGIELDATVTRLDEQEFLVVAPTAAQTKAFHWLRRHARGDAVITDVTSGLGALSVTGPRSRELLARLTDARLDDAAFPFATARTIDVGWATALAVRISFAGELGWELYAPVESLTTLFDQLLAEGAGAGLRLAGSRALDSLRAEKGFRHWGADMGPADTPSEAGLESAVTPDKEVPFIGRDALRRRAAGPVRRRLVHLRVDDPEPLLYHGESVLADGAVVGRVTSGAYGHTLGGAVGLALIEAPPDALHAIVTATDVEVDIAGRRAPATLSARAFYDPSGERLRGAAPVGHPRPAASDAIPALHRRHTAL
jgi:glycine cleavage system aminomethyltransferase T/glycine/D-amino acid oxidase-like deaminating enzyme